MLQVLSVESLTVSAIVKITDTKNTKVIDKAIFRLHLNVLFGVLFSKIEI